MVSRRTAEAGKHEVIEFSLADAGWIAALSLLALSAAAISLWRFQTTWTPLSIFVSVNCASLMAYHLRLLNLIEVSARTHLIVVMGLLSFGIGCLVPIVRPTLEAAVQVDRNRGLRPFFYLTGAASLVGWTLALLILDRRFTLSVLRENPWLLQNEFQMQYLGYLNLLGILVLPAYVLLRLERLSRRFDLVVVASALAGLVLAGIKQFVFFSVASSLLVYSARSPRRPRFRTLLFLVVVGIAFFVAYQNTIDIFTRRPFQGSRFPGWLLWMEMPYLYFVGSWPAMEQVLRGGAESAPITGYVVLQPALKILGDGLGLVEPLPAYLPFVSIGGGVFNVYSFIGEVWWDLGTVGVIVVCLIHGAVTTSLFSWARASGSWVMVVAYGVLAYSLVVSFFLYYIRFNLLLLFFFVLLVGASLRLRRVRSDSRALEELG